MKNDQEQEIRLVITPAAEKFMRRLLRFGGPKGSGFRLAVNPGGCSGLAAEFSVESVPRDGERVIEHNGMKIFLPRESCSLLDGVTVDFADTPMESGFVFIDPKGNGGACSSGQKAPVELIGLSSLPRK